MTTPAGTPVPELVRATNIAISHGFMDYADCNLTPAAPLPYGPQTEFQVTSPVVGTVNLKGLTDINGTSLNDCRRASMRRTSSTRSAAPRFPSART